MARAALLWIEENQLGRRDLPDDQRAALALRVADRRTALSINKRVTNAGEARAASAARDENGKMTASMVIGVGHHAGQAAAEKPKKTRIRTEVAKKASVSEKRIRAVAASVREIPKSLSAYRGRRERAARQNPTINHLFHCI